MATIPPVPLIPQTPPIPPKSEARRRVIRRPSRQQGVVVKNTRSSPGAYEQTATRATSEALIQLKASLDQLRSSSAPTELISHDERLSEPDLPERFQTYSTRSSGVSSACADTTITIEPSRDLQAMQSVGSDTGTSSQNSIWRHSNRYLSQSQSSLAPEVYLPTGCPLWLAEDLKSGHRPLPSAPSPHKLRKLEVKNWNQENNSIDPPTTDPDIYGPSPQDISDLIERRRTWDDEQDRKLLNPLKRIVSLSKEITGELRRKLSIGPTRKSFVPRLEREDGPVRTKSEK
jgi:hypothetical protein